MFNRSNLVQVNSELARYGDNHDVTFPGRVAFPRRIGRNPLRRLDHHLTRRRLFSPLTLPI